MGGNPPARGKLGRGPNIRRPAGGSDCPPLDSYTAALGHSSPVLISGPHLPGMRCCGTRQSHLCPLPPSPPPSSFLSPSPSAPRRLVHTGFVFTNPAAAAQVCEGFRPPRPSCLPDGVWSLIEAGWHDDPIQRPSMVERLTELREEEAANPSDPGGMQGCVAGCSVQ